MPNAAESNCTIVPNSAVTNGAIAPNGATGGFPNLVTQISGGNHTGAFGDMRRGSTAGAEQSSREARGEVSNRKLDSLQRDISDIKEVLEKLLDTREKLVPQAQV